MVDLAYKFINVYFYTYCVFLVFYWISILAQTKEQKERQKTSNEEKDFGLIKTNFNQLIGLTLFILSIIIKFS